MGKTDVTVSKGVAKIPEGMFVAMNHKGQLVQITENHFEIIKTYMLIGDGFYSIARKLREEHDHPTITYGGLLFFINLIEDLAQGRKLAFPVPDWMYGAAVTLLEIREGLRDQMYEKQAKFALAGDRMAFQFLLRQGRELVGLPEDIPEPGKKSGPKVVPDKTPMKEIQSSDVENVIEAAQEFVANNKERKNANA